MFLFDILSTSQEKKLWWEKKYVENINTRITQIQDVYDVMEDSKYFTDKKGYMNDICFELWTKDTYFENLISFFSIVFDGITINNKKYGGVKKILFCEIISALEDIILKLLVQKNFLNQNYKNYIYVFNGTNENEQSCNANVNSLLFGYLLYKNCVKLDLPFPEIVESIKDLKNKVIKEKCKNFYNLFIIDDISFSGNQLLNKIYKLQNSKLQGNIFFIFSYVLTDTIYCLYKYQERQLINKNIHIVFHSCIFNYPIFFQNKFQETNSRYFCLGNYYQSLFYFFTPLEKKFINFYSFDKECIKTRYCWYLYCEKWSHVMDLLPYDTQKNIVDKYGIKDNRLFPFEEKDVFYIQFNMNFCEYKINNSIISVNNKLLFGIETKDSSVKSSENE